MRVAALRFAWDFMVHERGFTPVTVPVLVREEMMLGTGFFPFGKEQAYEVGGTGRRSQMVRWGHIQGGKETIAFAVDGNPDLPGRYQFSLDGEGGTSIRFTESTPRTQHELTVYEHFVSPPVQIGAATSPTSMLSPLVATCDAKQFLLSRIQAPGSSKKRR